VTSVTWLHQLLLAVLELGAPLSSSLEEALYKCSVWMNEWMNECDLSHVTSVTHPHLSKWFQLCYLTMWLQSCHRRHATSLHHVTSIMRLQSCILLTSPCDFSHAASQCNFSHAAPPCDFRHAISTSHLTSPCDLSHAASNFAQTTSGFIQTHSERKRQRIQRKRE